MKKSRLWSLGLVAMAIAAAPFAARRTDVFYRARNLPAYFGRHGQLKARLGVRCQEAARSLSERGRPLRLDVSTRPEDTLLGEDWLRALGGARLCWA